MYIIINKTDNTQLSHIGAWPGKLLDRLLFSGKEVIVISLYSNSIKIPTVHEQYGEKESEWTNYPLPVTVLKKYMTEEGID
jgi:hypothetical protein